MAGQQQEHVNGAARGSAPARVMPHNLEAEASILGGVILRNEVLADLADLAVADFYDFRHRIVWEAIRNLSHAGRPVDVVTLEVEIAARGNLEALGPGFLGELTLRVPTADNVFAYRDTVRLHARNRRAILGLSSALERAYTWAHDPAELISEIAGDLHRIEDAGAARTRPTFELLTVDDALDDLGRLRDAPVFSTPFETLNRALGTGIDGMLGSQNYTIAAGTGIGKTTFVGALASHTAETGAPVIVSVHELGPGYFVARRAAGLLGRHSNDILRGHVDRALIHRVLPYPNLFFLTKPTLQGISDATDAVAQRFGRAPLVIVDYLQKLADQIAARQQRPDLRIATTEASDALIQIAERTSAAIVTVSSIGRGKTALKSPRKYHPYELVEVAKESGAVEYDSAGMIILTLSNERDGDEQVATITLGKARFGRVVHIDARFHGARGIWRDLGEVEVAERPEKAPAPAKAAKPPEEDREDIVRRAIIAELHKAPARNKTNLVDRVTGCRKETVRVVFERMVGEGTIAKVGTGFTLSPDGRQLVITTGSEATP